MFLQKIFKTEVQGNQKCNNHSLSLQEWFFVIKHHKLCLNQVKV